MVMVSGYGFESPPLQYIRMFVVTRQCPMVVGTLFIDIGDIYHFGTRFSIAMCTEVFYIGNLC